MLHHAKMPMEHVYFPNKALIPVFTRSAPDQWAEVYLIGSERFTGFPVLLSNLAQPALRRVVQVGGPVWRIDTDDLSKAVLASRSLEIFIRRYVVVVLLQSTLAAACNGRHSVKQRLARWLSMASDGLQDDVVPLTHAVPARLVGVRRPSVTAYLGGLQSEGVLRLDRGVVEITDHAALDAACCYSANLIRNDYVRTIEGHRTGALEESRRPFGRFPLTGHLDESSFA